MITETITKFYIKMKKLTIVAALAIAAVGFTSCGNSGAPKEELKSDVDSLSYAFGIDQGQNVKQSLLAYCSMLP